MNQSALIKDVARDTGLTKVVVNDVLDCLYNTIVKTISDGEDVKLFSGVVFESKLIPEHEATNPHNQESITIPEKIKCNVRLSETFKKRINMERV